VKRLLTARDLAEHYQVHEYQGTRVFALNRVYEFLRVEVPDLDKGVVDASRRENERVVLVVVGADSEDTVLVPVGLA
jgi:hypothetical protein